MRVFLFHLMLLDAVDRFYFLSHLYLFLLHVDSFHHFTDFECFHSFFVYCKSCFHNRRKQICCSSLYQSCVQLLQPADSKVANYFTVKIYIVHFDLLLTLKLFQICGFSGVLVLKTHHLSVHQT